MTPDLWKAVPLTRLSVGPGSIVSCELRRDNLDFVNGIFCEVNGSRVAQNQLPAVKPRNQAVLHVNQSLTAVMPQTEPERDALSDKASTIVPYIKSGSRNGSRYLSVKEEAKAAAPPLPSFAKTTLYSGKRLITDYPL